MDLIWRLAAVLLVGMVAGALVAHLSGWSLTWGALGGTLLAAAMAAAIDRWRARRLLRWLGAGAEGEPPRSAGVWSELGYRFERGLRLSDQRAAQGEARLAEFLAAIEASPNGVVTLDATERVTWANGTAQEHLDLSMPRDLAQPITNLVREPTFVQYLRERHQRREAAEPLQFTLHAGGPQLSVLARPYGDGATLLLTQDITERQRTEAMRRDFVANVSHEIRTPLTVLAGALESMQTLPLSEPERARMLHLMGQQSARMRTLVDDLLTLAQLEGSPRPPADQWVPLAPMLERAVEDGRALSGGRHELQLQAAPPAGLQVAGSQSELASAVGNLVSNAVRYSPDGGPVTLRWRREANGDGLIEVIDRGLGIERQHLSRLTERFYRVDGSRSRQSGGTGLGLAIVKHVIERHGGDLQVRSQPGHGSIFTLRLPARRLREGD